MQQSPHDNIRSFNGVTKRAVIFLEQLVMLEQVEARLRALEGKVLANDSAKVRGKADIQKYDPARQGNAGAALLTVPKAYNPDADVTADAGKEEKKKKKVRGSSSLSLIKYISGAISNRDMFLRLKIALRSTPYCSSYLWTMHVRPGAFSFF